MSTFDWYFIVLCENLSRSHGWRPHVQNVVYLKYSVMENGPTRHFECNVDNTVHCYISHKGLNRWMVIQEFVVLHTHTHTHTHSLNRTICVAHPPHSHSCVRGSIWGMPALQQLSNSHPECGPLTAPLCYPGWGTRIQGG